MHTHIRTLLFSVALLSVSAGVARAQTADDVINKHLAAIGGRDALSKITTRTATGTITVSTAAYELPGTIELISKAPNKSHSVLALDLSSVAAGSLTIEQVFDGKNGFVRNSQQGDTDMTGHQLENARNNGFPTMLLNYKEMGATLALLPASKLNGRDVQVVTVTPKSGPVVTLFFDAETYLLSRTLLTVDTQDGGSMPQTSDSSDYRTVDGVKVPFLTVNTNAAQTVTVKLDKVVHNLPVDDAIFVKK